ncbi:hypothetical protein KCU94_g239, partial [Aureobasidium melanogenum]
LNETCRFRFITGSGVRACEFGIVNASNIGRKSLSRFRDTIADSGDQRPFQEAAPLLALEDTMVETEARNSSNREFAREQACGRPSPRTRRNIARL